jgi:TRAP-type C4-dicarboxylate transport system permease small subunit
MAGWGILGLDAWAGYSIAAALFLALPHTFQRAEHIRVTLVLQRLPAKVRAAFEAACLGVGFALATYVAWFACRLVWTSYVIHDISTGADATPLWIPQIAMALGCVGFALAIGEALVAHLTGRPFFEGGAGAAHLE